MAEKQSRIRLRICGPAPPLLLLIGVVLAIAGEIAVWPSPQAAGQEPLVRVASRPLPNQGVDQHRDIGQTMEFSPESQAVIAGESQLTLANLEGMALANNPSVARAAARVRGASGNLLQVGLPPNPTLAYEGQQLASSGRAEQIGVALGQEFVRGGKLQLNRAIADRDLARARQELAVQEQRVLTDVRIAFYRVLLAQRTIELTARLVEISNQGSTAADSLFRAQEASRADVLQAQLEVENAKILAQNARNRYAAAWQSLTSIVGQPNLAPQLLDGDAFRNPEDIDFYEVLQQIYYASPEIAAAETDVERARAALARACAEPIPNITIEAAGNVIDNGIGGRPDAGLRLSFPVPVLNQNEGAIQQARHGITAAQRALDQLRLAIQNRLAPAFERYQNARYQVDRYRQSIIPAATESLDLMRRSYEAGESSFVSLLVAQRTYFQTNIKYLEAVEALRVAEAEINGQLLMGSLSGD